MPSTTAREPGTRPSRPRRVPDPLVGVLFAVGYLLAVLLGRTTRPEGAPLAVVWPAAAVGFLWVAWAGRHRPRRVVVSAAGIALFAGAVNVLTGAGWFGGALLGASGAVQAVVGWAVVRRRRGGADGPWWRLRSMEDFTTLIVASYTGAAAAAVVGIGALHHSSPGVALLTLVAWVLRVGTSTFVLTAAALRVADRSAPGVAVARRRREAVALVLTTVAGYVFVFTSPVQLPLAFAMAPISMWVALRFSTTTAAAHVVATGAFVVAATLAHLGPFGTAPAVLATTLLTQAFITVTGATTLVLALNRDERVRLVGEVRAGHLRAEEQAQLLSTVLAEMEEGIVLVDGSGNFLVRNRAAVELMNGVGTPAGSEPDPVKLGLFHPDGNACSREQMADVRALAGERVEQDYVLHRTDGAELVLATRAAPLTTAEGARRALVVFSDATAVRRAAADVARARDLFSGVLDAATDLAIISTDVQSRITVFNAGAERLLGHRAQDVLGRTRWFLHDPVDLAARLGHTGVAVADLLGGGPVDPVDLATLVPLVLGTQRWTLRTRTGHPVPVMTTTSLMRGEDGAVTGSMTASRDLTSELAAQADLADSEERFRLAFDTAPMGMMMVALTGERPGAILQVNPAMTSLLGHDQLDLLGMTVADLSHPDDLGITHDLLERHGTGELTGSRTEKRYRHRDGSTVWVRLSTAVVNPHDWEPYSLALIEDVTARKQAEEALTHQALHDPLTGLPNRSLFSDRLEHALAAAGRAARRVGVLYLDLDGFKAVNDTAGHLAGDRLLQLVAQRLTTSTRPGDTLARLGGDEFAVVCPDLDDGDDDGTTAAAHLLLVAHRVLAAVQEPVVLPTGTFTVGVSIGTALADPGTPPSAVLQRADAAMYRAKRAGRNRVTADASR